MGSTLNPQQAAFKENYTNPNSETFGNAYQSAKAAGFAEEYAQGITAPSHGIEWVQEIIRDQARLQKAEKVLDRTLELVDDKDVAKQKLAQDSAKFVASRLGKHKYADRQEHTGKDGAALPTPILSFLKDHGGTENGTDQGDAGRTQAPNE